jgi:conjugative relaxase-like TrwC/TraI family protein
VLSIGRLGSDPDPAAYYLEVVASGLEDYYLSADEAPGRWTGKGAPELGLARAVAPDDLRAVLAGNDPRSGERLVGWRKRPGYDLTLSAPKSVSLLWGLGDVPTAAAVAAAHEDAVDAAVAYLEDAACVVRRGRGGRVRLPGVGLVGAAFRHRTSRAGDPNLHSHAVVANMTRGPDGQWSALFSQAVFRHGRTAGFIYQAVLRHRLATQLGVGFGDASRGVREVEGVSATVRRAFSRRRVAIEAAMAEHGAHSKHGAQVAALDTRPDKQAGVSEATLRRAWQEQATKAGFDLGAVPRGSGPGSAAVPHDELGRRLTDRHATFERRAVLRAVAEAAVDGLTYPQIRARAEAFLSSAEAVEVSPERWTTPEMLAIEADAFHLADSGPRIAPVPADLVATALAERPSLSAEQQRAVEAVTGGDRPLSLVVGHAGTGKTFALDAARAAWQASGHQVIGAALAARAARQLQVGSGIPSSTVAALLGDIDAGRVTLGPISVLVVDEAGMVGSRHLHRLLRATTAPGARLVLVGDHRQLAEIDAGGLFAALARRFGCAELSENRRQRDPAQRAVVRALRDHDAERALLRLRRMGRLTVLHNAEHVRDRMAEDWLLEYRDGKQAVMLALHRSDVADLNRRARARLRALGVLGEAVLRLDGVDFAEGDRVMALRNHRRVGLLNGTRATVEGRTGKDLVVVTDEGTRVQVPLNYLLDGHVTHAYALTVHKSQGMTCDVTLVLGDDTLHAEAGYTAMTRGRLRNHLYAVADDAGDPLASVRRALARSTAKTTAHDHLGIAR